MKRKVGILLPIFSLPAKYGIGTLGDSAYAFVDFLSEAKMDFWQLLPTNPTSYGDSPYQSFSIYAQNTYFIDLELLLIDGLLTNDDLNNSNLLDDSNYINYGNLFVNKNAILKKAYKKHKLFNEDFKRFKKENKKWLNDFAVYMILKRIYNYKSFDNWPEPYKYKKKDEINELKSKYRYDIDEIKFEQFLYYKQYSELKKYANSKNILLIGDMPIYVAYDSVDVWSNPNMFLLDQWLKPTSVAGVPPDYFSMTGQLWGNPLYDYENMEKKHFKWWIDRIKYQLSLTDYARIDHFRAFSAYYSIPYGSKDATNGEWIEGPKMKLFSKINKSLKNHNIIAENLGLLDDDVYKLIKDCKYPGMRVLEFEMYSKENIEMIKHFKVNNVLYPGTHDNAPFVGWFNEYASSEEKENILEEFALKENESLSDGLIRYCYSLPFKYVIISMQDILGLGNEARLNTPGKGEGNWSYRFKNSDFNSDISSKLALLKEKYLK